jgi:hypothetical protein
MDMTGLKWITRVRMSLEEVLALPETTQRMDVHDGEITALAQPTIRHQEAAGELFVQQP